MALFTGILEILPPQDGFRILLLVFWVRGPTTLLPRSPAWAKKYIATAIPLLRPATRITMIIQGQPESLQSGYVMRGQIITKASLTKYAFQMWSVRQNGLKPRINPLLIPSLAPVATAPKKNPPPPSPTGLLTTRLIQLQASMTRVIIIMTALS